jgi:aryl sulfotransferase
MFRPALREYRTWAIDSRRWKDFAPRDGDIIIATAPKCGTTWMQQIVGSLIFQDTAARPLPAISPWIDGRAHGPAPDIYRALAAQTHRRFVKTHVPADGLPLYEQVRYIHVARDGRDAVMSMHNHFTAFPDERIATFDRIGLTDPMIARRYLRAPADPNEFFLRWISTAVVEGQSDGCPDTSFFDLEAGYWAERRRANMLLVHYNDLLANPDAEMRRVAAFLEVAINDEIWPSLVRAATFNEMQRAGDRLMPQTITMRGGGSRRFFNKGTNGQWRGVLTERDLALYERKVQEKFSSGLAKWIEGGRSKAGDPRGADDR